MLAGRCPVCWRGSPGGRRWCPTPRTVPGPGSPGLLPGATVPPLAGAMTRQWQPPFPLDWSRTLGVHRRGRGDPAYLTDQYGAAWRTSLTPEGPATMRVHAVPGGSLGVPCPARRPAAGRSARPPGPGAAWLLDSLPGLLGAADDPSGFEPVHPLLTEMSRRHHALRIGRSDRVFEALIPAVLEQKVVGAEAKRAWRLLLLRFGDPAPGRRHRGCGCARRREPGSASPPGSGTAPGWNWSASAPSSVRPGSPGSWRRPPR